MTVHGGGADRFGTWTSSNLCDPLVASGTATRHRQPVPSDTPHIHILTHNMMHMYDAHTQHTVLCCPFVGDSFNQWVSPIMNHTVVEILTGHQSLETSAI